MLPYKKTIIDLSREHFFFTLNQVKWTVESVLESEGDQEYIVVAERNFENTVVLSIWVVYLQTGRLRLSYVIKSNLKKEDFEAKEEFTHSYGEKRKRIHEAAVKFNV